MKRTLAKHSPLVILAALCVVMAVMSPEFRQAGNVQEVMRRTAVIGILAAGELLVILIAGIDLSVGRVAGLAGVVGAITMKYCSVQMGDGFAVPAVLIGIAAGSGVGLACGIVNGVLVTIGRIPPFIVTLGMMMVAHGATLLISGGVTVAGLPAQFAWLGGAKGWWMPVLITVSITAVIAVALTFTRWGRAIYAIGGNLQSARLSGLSVDRVRTSAFAISGLCAGFAGMVLASRSSVATPNAGEMYELDAIAACVIGGASLMGGEGSAVAALAGALIMMVLRNFCNLEDISIYWQQVLIGALIVTLVFYDNWRKRRAGLLKD
ncbi:MAG: ABC transporter permease [Candidatus Hydrogenedentes bacterium]|nr:ABC transporter permease [Candidatus Hydrogenedentota bacterium]